MRISIYYGSLAILACLTNSRSATALPAASLGRDNNLFPVELRNAAPIFPNIIQPASGAAFSAGQEVTVIWESDLPDELAVESAPQVADIVLLLTITSPNAQESESSEALGVGRSMEPFDVDERLNDHSNAIDGAVERVPMLWGSDDPRTVPQHSLLATNVSLYSGPGAGSINVILPDDIDPKKDSAIVFGSHKTLLGKRDDESDDVGRVAGW